MPWEKYTLHARTRSQHAFFSSAWPFRHLDVTASTNIRKHISIISAVCILYGIPRWLVWMLNNFWKFLKTKWIKGTFLIHSLKAIGISWNRPFLLIPHFIYQCLFWPIRCIIWNLASVAFLFKVWYSLVIYRKVPSGKNQKAWYLQTHWTFRRRDYGCSQIGWLHGQTVLREALCRWMARWDRWAWRTHCCTGAGLTPAPAPAGMALLK